MRGFRAHTGESVVEGLFRVVRRHANGREVTARYVTVGDLVGLWGVLGEDRPVAVDASLNTEVIHDTVVVAFDPVVFRAELDREAAFGRAISRYVFACCFPRRTRSAAACSFPSAHA